MPYISTCRNCECLHFYGSGPHHDYPSHCYCIEAYHSIEKCKGYTPKDNLEYLEWILEHKELA